MNEVELLHKELSPDLQVQQYRDTKDSNTEDGNLDNK